MTDPEDKSPENFKEFFNISAVFEKDDSPEGEYQATRLSQAKTSLYLDTPFFGWILGQLEIYPTKDPRVPAYAADTRKIYFNPKFTEDKKPGRLKGMLMHLVTHLVMKHGERKAQSDRNIFGMSSDIATNLLVEETNQKIFHSSQFTDDSNSWEVDPVENIPSHLQNKATEENYDILYNYAESLRGIEEVGEETEADKQEEEEESIDDPNLHFSEKVYDEVKDYSGIQNPCGFGLAMELMEASMDDGMADLEKERMSGIVRNAASQSREFGDLPSEIKEQVENLLEPKIPWYHMLEQYVQKVIISDWTWNPPNKRMIGHGYHLPSTTKEYLNVVVAVDTSGSIRSEELASFVSEAHSILTSFSSVRMILIDCDAKVQQVVTIEEGMAVDGSKLPWEGRPFKGRGGTAFEPVFNWVQNHGEQPDLLLYFTDGWGSFPDVEPPYPTVWIMTTDAEAPFGEVIRYNEENQ